MIETRVSPHRMVAYGPEPAAARLIARAAGPTAWAYVRLDGEGEEERALQVRHARDVLERAGAAEAAVTALTDRIAIAAVAPVTLAVFVDAEGRLLHEQLLPVLGSADLLGWTAPAHLVPLLAQEEMRPPYVHVVIDRAGADLTACAGGPEPAARSQVMGHDDEIERNAPGGWAQPRYQRRAEDSWRHNARQVADAALAAVADVGAQVLVLSGDVRAVQLLKERLPDDPILQVRQLSGSRSADGSQADRDDRLAHVLRDAAAAQTRHVLELFRSRLDPRGHAVQGIDDTVGALTAGRVAILLVGADLPDRQVWFGAAATELYTTQGAALSPRPVHSGALVDVAVRSALLSGARVRIVPPDPADGLLDGLGALCRFRD